MDGYYYLRIYASKVSKFDALKGFIKDKNKAFVITFGSKIHDLEMIKLADFSVALKHADENIIGHVDYVMDSVNPDDIVKLMHKNLLS